MSQEGQDLSPPPISQKSVHVLRPCVPDILPRVTSLEQGNLSGRWGLILLWARGFRAGQQPNLPKSPVVPCALLI